MITTDVAIVGGGPGGASTAIYLARKGIRSVIIEKEPPPRYHIGESMTGECGQRVRDLGLGDYMMEARHPHKFGVKVYGPGAENSFFVPVMERNREKQLSPGQTWQVRRDIFDQKMLEEAERQQANIIYGRALDVLLENGGVRGVRVEQDGGESINVRSRVVVDASGHSTFLSNSKLLPRKQRGKYDSQLAVFSQVTGAIRDEGQDRDNTLILYKDKNHWAWFIPLDEEVVSVGVVIPSAYFKSTRESMDAFFRRELRELHPELSRRIPEINIVEQVRGCSNYSYEIDRYVGDGFLCVGDSHRFIDPVFSFGLHFAIHEGEKAADAIARHFASGKPMCNSTFNDYQRVCNIGMDAIQELIDAFWNNPIAFAYCVHHRHTEDFIDLFAGRVYSEVPSAGLIAMKKINEKFRENHVA